MPPEPKPMKLPLTGPQLRGLTRTLTAGSLVRFVLAEGTWEDLEVASCKVETHNTRNPETKAGVMNEAPTLVIVLKRSPPPPESPNA